MAQLENKTSLEAEDDTDVNTYLLEIFKEIKPTKLQDSERSDPREEFPLPNAKRSRITDSDSEGDQTDSEDEYQTDNEGDQTNEFSDPQNFEVFKNPFNMFQNTEDLFSQLNEFLVPNSFPFTGLNPVCNDPLLNSYISENSAYIPYESCEPTFYGESFFPDYNFMNDLQTNSSSSHPDLTNRPQTPLQPPETPCNTSNLSKEEPKYHPFDESKSLLHGLLTAPLKPKVPRNPSILHRLISSSGINNSTNDEITVLSHVKDKAEVSTNETHMFNTTFNNSVCGVKHKAVIDSAVGKLVMSFVLPTTPIAEFGPTFKTKKREECSICHKRFENKYKLKIHMNCHTGNRPYICETCGASFLRSTNLVAHRRTHKPKEYQCPLCGKLFAHNSDRVVHIVCQVCITLKNMLEPTTNGWYCKECGENLSKKSELERHVKKHKKSRTCPICFLDFSHVREHQLVSHVRTYHPTWLENYGI